MSDCLELITRITGKRICFDILLVHFEGTDDLRFEIWLFLYKFPKAEAFHALHQQADSSIGCTKQTMDSCDRPNPIKLVRTRHFLFRIECSHKPDKFVASDDIIHQFDRTCLSHRQRDSSVWINNYTAQRQDRQGFGKTHSVVVAVRLGFVRAVFFLLKLRKE